MKKLVIAEKPSVASDLAKVLGRVPKNGDFYENDEWVISSALGHLVELLMPQELDESYRKWSLDNLPMLPKQFKTKPVDKTKKKFQELKKLLNRKDIDLVINACDAGREGELIFTHIYELSKSKIPVKRLWMSSMTTDAIKSAFSHLRDDAQMVPLREAARSRQEADWLVGLNATRGATVTFGRRGGTAANVGRVQTPTLAMVCEREDEIRNFVPRAYWEIIGTFSLESGKYQGIYQRPDFKKNDDDAHDKISRLWQREPAEDIAEAVRRAGSGLVEDLKKRTRQVAPRLYDLTTLQREASNRFGFSAANTLSIAQALYERHKVLTYPRTDSRALPQDYGETCHRTLQSLEGSYAGFAKRVLQEKWVNPNDRRVFNDKQVSDHFAIIPTESAPKRLSEAEQKIYDMVTRRFLAVFYPAAEYDVTTRMTVVGEHRFKTEGKILAVPGWLEVYGKSAQNESPTEDSSKDNTIPALQADEDSAKVENVEVRADETRPPPRYTEATLLSAMENAGKMVEDDDLAEAMKERGLGTPATRAGIIDHLVRESYMERDGRELRPSSKGEGLVGFLRALKVDILTSPRLTGEWEYRLKQIEEGQLSRKEFMEGIVGVTKDVVSKLKKPPEAKPSSLRSFSDGQPLMENFKCLSSCDSVTINHRDIPVVMINKVIGGRALEEQEIATLLKDREIGPLDGFRSKKGKAFSATLRLVAKENGTHRVEIDFGNGANGENGEDLDLSSYPVIAQCPICGGKIHETPAAYVCEKTPSKNCTFRIGRSILGRTLEQPQFLKLINQRKTDLIQGFVSNRTRRKFDAHLILKEDFSLGFEFPERPARSARKKTASRSK